MKQLFSAEQVSKYHPDKYADQISDAGVKMMEQYSLFDLPGNEKYKPKESREWDWKLSDLSKVQKNGLKVFSCFACGGGSTMGYKLAGCEVLGCVEIDKRMNDIYAELAKDWLSDADVNGSKTLKYLTHVVGLD